MPIHVDIRINEKLINSLHIGRMKGGTNPDDVNDYLVVEGKEPELFADWVTYGIPFRHRYGAGAEVCVMKAIQIIKDCDNYMTDEEFPEYLHKREEEDNE